MKTTKRKFTTEFKEEAVRLVLQEGLSTPDAARRIEISDKTLANWVRVARRGKALSSNAEGAQRRVSSVSELEMEVSKLRAENARLKMEKEILKKATAFFVKESQGSPPPLTRCARAMRWVFYAMCCRFPRAGTTNGRAVPPAPGSLPMRNWGVRFGCSTRRALV